MFIMRCSFNHGSHWTTLKLSLVYCQEIIYVLKLGLGDQVSGHQHASQYIRVCGIKGLLRMYNYGICNFLDFEKFICWFLVLVLNKFPQIFYPW